MIASKHNGLIALRENYELSQSELSRKLGFSRSYIHCIENRRLKGNIAFWHAVKIYFEISNDDIISLMSDTLDVTPYLS